jgi:MHS family metabolite:H+ symporter-like MFS transporter
LGAGAEQAGASVLMAEYAPPRRRGLFAALPYVGVQFGAIAAPLIVLGLSPWMKPTGIPWLWRAPFLLSVVIVGVGLWIRLRLQETPTFAALKARHQVAAHPLRDVIRRSWRLVLVGIGLRFADVGSSSLYQVLAISYLVKVAGHTAAAGTFCLLFAATISAPIVPLAGALTDRFGRLPVYRAFAALQLGLALPVWWLFDHGPVWSAALALGLVLGVGCWGQFGSQAALLPELFGAQHRYIGVALAREVSAPLAGGTAPLIGAAIIGWSTTRLGSAHAAWLPLAAYGAVLCLITLVASLFAPEAAGRDLDLLDDASMPRRTAAGDQIDA